MTRVRSAVPARCRWCGLELPRQEGTGRPRQYCGHACRQRAYESRSAAVRGQIPVDAVVLSGAEAADLADRLYQVRCAAEDVQTAVGERAGLAEIEELVAALLDSARAAERLR